MKKLLLIATLVLSYNTMASQVGESQEANCVYGVQAGRFDETVRVADDSTASESTSVDTTTR